VGSEGLPTSVVVFAPSLSLSITIEASAGGDDEIHLHAAGQGFWVSRMAGLLGARVVLCTTVGGETGEVLGHLASESGVEVHAVESSQASHAYLQDRRRGERDELAASVVPDLGRHEVDQLYGLALSEGLSADAVLLTGPKTGSELPADVYRRFASDLRRNGRSVYADLSGEALAAAVDSGIDFVKVSDDELVEGGYARSAERDELESGMARLREAGARDVLVSRGEGPALAAVDDELVSVSYPRFEVAETRGTGDSMFAAVAVRRAAGEGWEHSLREGVAAGTLNVTRRGLGSGDADQIDQLAGRVELEVR
jgi:1-phosphofructokinase